MKDQGHWNMPRKPKTKKIPWKIKVIETCPENLKLRSSMKNKGHWNMKTWKQESLISLKIEAQEQRHTLTKSYGDRAEDSSTPESLMSLKIEAPRTLRSLRVDS